MIRINGIPIVSAGNSGMLLGEVRIVAKKNKPIEITWQTHIVRGEADPDTIAILKPFVVEVDNAYSKPLASSIATYEYEYTLPRRQETAIGNFVNDATIWYVKNILSENVDFAFLNGGSIRAGLPTGIINTWDIFETIPFNNNIMIVEMNGTDIIEFFEYVAAVPLENPAFGQVSAEVQYTVDYTVGTKGILKTLTINRNEISAEKKYRFVTIDFVVNGGGSHKLDVNNRHKIKDNAIKITNTGVNYRDALIAYLQYNVNIKPVIDGRIKIIK